jgi:hypothetical protein
LNNGILNPDFSLEDKTTREMYNLLIKNLIETITLNDIVNNVYTLLPVPRTGENDVDFNEVPTKVDRLDQLFQLRPNDIVEWNGFLFKFYDFNNKSHEKYKSLIQINTNSVCKKQIKDEYLKESTDACDYLITVTDSKEYQAYKSTSNPDLNDSPDLKNIYAFIMNNTLNYGTKLNTYTSILCSMDIYGDDGESKVITFGLLIMYIMLNYLKSVGFVNAYLDAAYDELLPYYSRWNYRLGKGSCELADAVTEKHNEIIKLNVADELKSFYSHLDDDKYTTEHGYRMKLCGIDLTGWTEYLIKTNTGIKERLEANQLVYVYFNDYQDKIKKIQAIKLLDDEINNFMMKSTEEQKLLVKDLLSKILIYDNKKIYEIVSKLAVNKVITIEELDNNLLAKIKQQVTPGPFMNSMRGMVINMIKKRIFPEGV